MKDSHFHISAGIARDLRSTDAMTTHATTGLVAFLYEQIADAEWRITRARAEIEAYTTAINAINKKDSAAALSPPGRQDGSE